MDINGPPAAEDGHNNSNGSVRCSDCPGYMKANFSYSHTQNEIAVESPFDEPTTKAPNNLAHSVFSHFDVDTNRTLQNQMADIAGEQEAVEALQGSVCALT